MNPFGRCSFSVNTPASVIGILEPVTCSSREGIRKLVDAVQRGDPPDQVHALMQEHEHTQIVYMNGGLRFRRFALWTLTPEGGRWRVIIEQCADPLDLVVSLSEAAALERNNSVQLTGDEPMVEMPLRAFVAWALLHPDATIPDVLALLKRN